MKLFRYITISALFSLLIASCNEGIDPITPVAPGPDENAPVVTLKYPTEGTKIQVPELITSINIQFEVTDDIELDSISVIMDGTKLIGYRGFKDYRRAVKEYLYDHLTNGVHVLTIKATDLTGKVTNKTINFEKKPPYTPVFAGEIFYMPFDGDYMEKVSFQTASKVGSPGFAGVAFKGLNAYAGATDSYLTFPAAGLKNAEFSAAFWYKPNSSPDRAGIISISPPGEVRTSGLRFFREGSVTSQRFKLNVGTGTGETWNDGGTITLPTNDWVHLAFTVSSTQCVVYINGAVAMSVPSSAISWANCDMMSIASGAPNFSYWDHKSDNSYYDELRIFNKALSQAEIQNIITYDSPYVPKYTGETFYMPFDGNYKELISSKDATMVGSPGLADGRTGQAYAGATGAYLTYPTTGLTGSEFSAAFWYKLNATPDRAGILVIGPPDATAPTAMNNRNAGFRFFRESSSGKQRFKLNVGSGSADSWFDGGTAADVDPATTTGWIHLAFTISATRCAVYINGQVVSQGSFTGVDWTGCDILSIMSGAPRFTGWDHLSDNSLMDDLRLFNRALTQTEITNMYNGQ